jgi:hypothetical protein
MDHVRRQPQDPALDALERGEIGSRASLRRRRHYLDAVSADTWRFPKTERTPSASELPSRIS